MSNAQPTQPPPDGDQSQSQAIVGMSLAMLVLSFALVFLRFIVKIFVVKKVWWDDWTILFAFIGTAVGTGLDMERINYGFGHHRYYISSPGYNRFLYYGYGNWIQVFATLMWTKISICLFLYKIPATKALKRPLIAAIVVLVVSNIILELLFILQCSPVNAAWDLTVSGKCFSKDQLLQIILAQGVISAISDYTLAAYPILILARLQISLRKKIGLCLLMGLGVITGACCTVRLALNWTNEDPDPWVEIPNWMWRTLEVNFGMAAASLPAVYPGYRVLRLRIARALSSSGYGHRSSKAESGKERLVVGDMVGTGGTGETEGKGVDEGGYGERLVPLRGTHEARADGRNIAGGDHLLPISVPQVAILKTTGFDVRS